MHSADLVNTAICTTLVIQRLPVCARQTKTAGGANFQKQYCCHVIQRTLKDTGVRTKRCWRLHSSQHLWSAGMAASCSASAAVEITGMAFSKKATMFCLLLGTGYSHSHLTSYGSGAL